MESYLPSIKELPRIKFDSISVEKKVNFLKHYLDYYKEEGDDGVFWSVYGPLPDISSQSGQVYEFLDRYNHLSYMNEEATELSIVRFKSDYILDVCMLNDEYANIVESITLNEEEALSVLAAFAETSVYNEYLGCAVWKVDE